MQLPNGFVEQFAKVFYDKSVEVYSKTTSKDAEGGVMQTVSDVPTAQFLANVRYTALGELQAEIGLTHKINFALTCLPEAVVEVDNILSVAGKKFVTTEVIPYDSHKVVVGVLWHA